MKKILFAALAATILFAACSKENSNPVQQGDNVLMVKLPGNVKVRSVEDQVATSSTTTVSNAIVFMISGDAVSSFAEFTEEEITAKAKRIEQVSNTVDKVIVVANVPEDELAGLKAAATYDGVKNYAFTIAGQNADAGIENKTLMGEGTPGSAMTDPDTSHDGDHIYKEVEITLNALTARFEIGAIDAGEGIVSVDLVGVWINNYYTDGSKVVPTTALTGFNDQSSTYWTTSPATTTSPSTSPFTTVDITNAYAPAQYFNAYDARVKLDAETMVYAFHIFAGANIPHVIMLVKGEYDEGYYEDGKKFFLGWITFRNYYEGESRVTSIQPNMIYKIGVGTSGVVIDADDEVITDDPEESFDLGVNCTVAPWTTKTVTPSVN